MNTRRKAFEKLKLKTINVVLHAGVSTLAPTKTGPFTIVILDGKLWIAQVLTMYSKGGGKAGKYSWVPNASSISGVSYLFVQLWEHWKGSEHHAYRFARISWQHLLYVVLHSGKLPHIQSCKRMRVLLRLFDQWGFIKGKLLAISGAVEQRSARQRGEVDASDED
ncbi:hypothetical protein FRC09_019933 [Ceratobasidium sp. 395]|nr:hypothetical protein FRC09_019933 [Ceratobasidium sp. 395]